MSWAEGNLLHLLEIVLWVAVKNHFADWNQGVVLLRPDLVKRRGRKEVRKSQRAGFITGTNERRAEGAERPSPVHTHMHNMPHNQTYMAKSKDQNCTHLSEVKGVKLPFLSLFICHHLDVHSPGGLGV